MSHEPETMTPLECTQFALETSERMREEESYRHAREMEKERRVWSGVILLLIVLSIFRAYSHDSGPSYDESEPGWGETYPY